MLALCLFSTAATLWRQAELPSAPVPSSLASMAERAASNLRSAEQRACCFESTTGGLIQASLLASPGASKFTTCGAVAYTSSCGVGVLGPSDARPLGEPLDAEGHRSRPQDAAAYVASKQERAQALARRKRLECGAEWCVSENGACGPTAVLHPRTYASACASGIAQAWPRRCGLRKSCSVASLRSRAALSAKSGSMWSSSSLEFASCRNLLSPTEVAHASGEAIGIAGGGAESGVTCKGGVHSWRRK